MRRKGEKGSELRRALRELLSDIEGMYEGAEAPQERGQPEEFFGPFFIGEQRGSDLEGGMSVSWPNLAISMRNARNALREADAEDVATSTPQSDLD